MNDPTNRPVFTGQQTDVTTLPDWAGLKAACDKLFTAGVSLGWWDEDVHWDRPEDPIGRYEFAALVEVVLRSQMNGEKGNLNGADTLYEAGSYHGWWKRRTREDMRADIDSVPDVMLTAYRQAMAAPRGPQPQP